MKAHASGSTIRLEYQLDGGKVIFKPLRITDWKALMALLEDGEFTVDRMISVLQRVIEEWTLPGDPLKTGSYRAMNEITFAQLCHVAKAYFAEALMEFRDSKRLVELGWRLRGSEGPLVSNLRSRATSKEPAS